MNLPFFLARRFYKSPGKGKRISGTTLHIATAGVAAGLAVMIISVCVVLGFKGEIRSKVIGFGAHIEVLDMNAVGQPQYFPIHPADSLIKQLERTENVHHVQRVSVTTGLLKTDDSFRGISLKGAAEEYDTTFLASYLVEGSLPRFSASEASADVLLSRQQADALGLRVGDRVYAYFFDKTLKMRRFRVSGIYQTDFSDYDKLLMIGDVRQVQRLNGWNPDQYSEIELLVNDFDQADNIAYDLYTQLIDRPDDYGTHYYPQSIRTLNPIFFGWLDLLDMNVWIILILMAAVSGFTMISGLLIIILERANMIGILKALGANNTSIREIFLYVSTFLVGKGMIWGNVIGLALCFLQQQFHIIKLNPEAYYVPYVPIELNFWYILWLNIGCMVISVLMLIAPSYLVSLIRPAKSIKFE